MRDDVERLERATELAIGLLSVELTSAPIARYGTLQASIKLLHVYAALLASERDIQEGRCGTAGDI